MTKFWWINLSIVRSASIRLTISMIRLVERWKGEWFTVVSAEILSIDSVLMSSLVSISVPIIEQNSRECKLIHSINQSICMSLRLTVLITTVLKNSKCPKVEQCRNQSLLLHLQHRMLLQIPHRHLRNQLLVSEKSFDEKPSTPLDRCSGSKSTVSW